MSVNNVREIIGMFLGSGKTFVSKKSKTEMTACIQENNSKHKKRLIMNDF